MNDENNGLYRLMQNLFCILLILVVVLGGTWRLPFNLIGWLLLLAFHAVVIALKVFGVTVILLAVLKIASKMLHKEDLFKGLFLKDGIFASYLKFVNLIVVRITGYSFY